MMFQPMRLLRATSEFLALQRQGSVVPTTHVITTGNNGRGLLKALALCEFCEESVLGVATTGRTGNDVYLMVIRRGKARTGASGGHSAPAVELSAYSVLCRVCLGLHPYKHITRCTLGSVPAAARGNHRSSQPDSVPSLFRLAEPPAQEV